MGKFQYEKAVICFSRAITLQPEQLYVSQAEAYLQLCDFQSAAACYKKAWLLEPGAFRDRLAFIYYLQFVFYGCHFVSNPHTLFINVLSALYPSLACLTAAGHLTDCLQLVNDWMVSDGPTSDLYILRARLHQQLHQVSQCYRDVTSALALNPSCPAAGALLQQLQRAGEQARQKSVDRAVSGELPEALCMINIALENCPRDARLYLFRDQLMDTIQTCTSCSEPQRSAPT
uniref:Tetratricopeptide repeat domain 16 n=1 Tax=Seriola dumerili TaxID=41447 RepID=A0A3B4UJY8_SERDU